MADTKVTLLDPSSETVHVVIIFEPLPGKMSELEALINGGLAGHQADLGCLFWHASKTLEMQQTEDGFNKDAGEGAIVLLQSWVNMQALQDHGNQEDSKKTRAALGSMLAKPPVMQVSKTFVGFRREVS